jgi:hypothetical protein
VFEGVPTASGHIYRFRQTGETSNFVQAPLAEPAPTQDDKDAAADPDESAPIYGTDLFQPGRTTHTH